jgi:hypothetical protein
MTMLTGHITNFAKLLAHHRGGDSKPAGLHEWIDTVTADDLPAQQSRHRDPAGTWQP